MSPSETSMLDQADPLREEDSDLFAAATPRKVSPGSTTSSAAPETPVSVNAPAAPAPAPALETEAGAAAAAAAGAGPSVRSSAAGGDPTAARAEPAGSSGTPLLHKMTGHVIAWHQSLGTTLHGPIRHDIIRCITWCSITLRSISVTWCLARFCMLDSNL